MKFLDGAYVDRGGKLDRFAGVKAPGAAELSQLTHTIAHCIGQYLERQGLLLRDAEQSYLALDESEKRPSLTRLGKVRYELKTPYRDGTTHVIFEPVDFIAKLAARVPRPRINLTRYHGVFAPNSKHRALVTPAQHRQRRGCLAEPKIRSDSAQSVDLAAIERRAGGYPFAYTGLR